MPSSPSIPNWKELGEREYARLADRYPAGTIRNILRAVKGQLIYEGLDAAARGEVDKLTIGLQEEFATGPALFILNEADKAVKRAEWARHNAGKTAGGNLTTDKHE